MRGFTLIEVMVALVIVAFGMGAVLATLSSAANNIAALHDKTLAQWIALNLVADTRLNLQVPSAGITEGDVSAFGGADWHWQQEIVAVPTIPGLMEITARVQRTGTSTAAEIAARASGFGSSSSSSSSSGSSSIGSSTGFASSGGIGHLGLSSGSSGSLGTVSSGITKFASAGKDRNWLATVIGFRGDAVAAASGASSSSGGSSSSGAVLNPGTTAGDSTLSGSSSGAAGGGSSGAN
jgi:general secretion pathway protein I